MDQTSIYIIQLDINQLLINILDQPATMLSCEFCRTASVAANRSLKTNLSVNVSS